MQTNSSYRYSTYSSPSDFLAHAGTKNETKSLLHTRLGYELRIFNGGHIPKTGVILCRILEKIPLEGKDVLEVGTGETAILAIHTAALGAKSVIALDVRPQAMRSAKKNVEANELSAYVTLIHQPIQEFNTNKVFDLIVSNPPQMPVSHFSSFHDDGGIDGRDTIMNIISFAQVHTRAGGYLIFNAFDYLGVDQSYNNKPSLFSILRARGFKPRIAHSFTKDILGNSYTKKHLSWILKQYPRFHFSHHQGHLAYSVKIIVAQRANVL